jgi:hypothetical protein
MTPLERAARALCRLDDHPENARLDGQSLWRDYIPEVRAVLTAVRDPSDKMQDAAYRMEWSTGGDGDAADANAINVWQAMIDAILKEGR